MKKFIFILLIGLGFLNAQNSRIPNLTTCETHETPVSCSYFTIHNSLLNLLNTLPEKQRPKNDTKFAISSSLRFDLDGTIDKENSLFHSKTIELESFLRKAITNIPAVKFTSSEDKKYNNREYKNVFYFEFENNRFSTWNNQSTAEADHFIPSTFPLYPGCKDKYDKEKRRKCFAERISKDISNLFDFRNVDRSKLIPGSQTRIAVFFKIDKTGKIINVGARADNKSLEKEAIRVIKSITGIEPATLGNNTVAVPYSIPIIVKVPFK